MTTIGYGDITPATHTAKIIATLYLPLAVIALARRDHTAKSDRIYANAITLAERVIG